MSKEEFLDTLRKVLARELSESEVADNINYYWNYIEQQVASGKSEEQVLSELGDPRLIARRIIAHASEDGGLANPTAMLQAVAASQALEAVGLPEARLSMAQAIIAICESPKSNSVVMALDQSVADAEKGGFGPVPIHLRDTHYAGHERLGSGAQYQYPHDFPGHWVKQEYMPPEVKGRRYYIPSDQGQELKLRERRKLRGIIDP